MDIFIFNGGVLLKLIFAIGSFYFVQTLIGGIVFQAIPAWLRSHNVDLYTIGLVSLAMIPWTLRVLWAGGVERYRVTASGKIRSKQIVIAGQVALAVILIGLSFIHENMFITLISLLILLSLVCCTSEIACDAYMIENLNSKSYGIGNGLRIGCGYLGMAVGGGGLIYLYDKWGWQSSLLVYSALLLFLLLPLLLAPSINQLPVTEKSYQRPSLIKTLKQPMMLKAIVLVFFFEISGRLISSMLSPFAIDAGLSLENLGKVTSFGGAACGMLGTLSGMLFIRIIGYRWALLLATLFKCLSISCFIILSLQPDINPIWLIVSYLFFNYTFSVGLVCLYSFLTTQASLKQAGLDFTLFQCGAALAAGCSGYIGGIVAHYMGYVTLFNLTLGCALFVLIFLYRSSILKAV